MIRQHEKTLLPTSFGQVALHIFETNNNEKWYVNVFGIIEQDDVFVRIHDACFTSELFSSTKCDCRLQLQQAKHILSQKGGILIYSPQEGRGIGSFKKIQAYTYQVCDGLNTDDANLMIGQPIELRDYSIIPHIFRALNVKSIQLLSNNPKKMNDLVKLGIKCVLYTYNVISWPSSQSYLKHKSENHSHKLYVQSKTIEVDTIIQKILSFRHSNVLSKPFLIVSYAQTLNGCLTTANYDSLKISSDNSNYIVHAIRAMSDYIVVGANTIRKDNPLLTTRLVSGPNPQKIVFSNKLEDVPLTSNILYDKNNIFFHTNSEEKNISKFSEFGKVLQFDGNLHRALMKIGNDETTIMIEGGMQIISQLILHADLVVVSISKQKIVPGKQINFSESINFDEKFRFEDEKDLILFGNCSAQCEICE